MSDPFSQANGAIDGLSSQMARLDSVTSQFGRTLSKSLLQGIAQGKSFEDILKGMGEKLMQMSLNAAFKPLENIVSGLFGALTGTAGGLVSATLGGGSGPKLTGGTLFGAPAGMVAPGGKAITVNMAVSTPDAESFKRSEAQVSAALARAVARGQRSL